MTARPRDDRAVVYARCRSDHSVNRESRAGVKGERTEDVQARGGGHSQRCDRPYVAQPDAAQHVHSLADANGDVRITEDREVPKNRGIARKIEVAGGGHRDVLEALQADVRHRKRGALTTTQALEDHIVVPRRREGVGFRSRGDQARLQLEDAIGQQPVSATAVEDRWARAYQEAARRVHLESTAVGGRQLSADDDRMHTHNKEPGRPVDAQSTIRLQ